MDERCIILMWGLLYCGTVSCIGISYRYSFFVLEVVIAFNHVFYSTGTIRRGGILWLGLLASWTKCSMQSLQYEQWRL